MNAKRERRTLWWAVIGSFFVHVIVALSLASFNSASTPVPLADEDKPVELTVVDLSATPPPMRANPAYVATSEEAPEQPKDKTFESNANSIAMSKSAASGDAPLPSQDGKEEPFMDLQTQNYSLPSQGAPPQPQSQPTATPPPATPTPKATPVPTPKVEPTATPEPEQFAMLKATPPPPLSEPQEAEATPTATPPTTTPLASARPLPERPSSAYQPQKQETKITGRISNRGARSAVDAVGTPLGKYQKQVSDAIGARWYFYMNDRIDLVSVGTAHLEAEVDDKGKVQNLRVLSNNANEAFANICLQSFQEAQIPPIPPDLVPTLPNGKLPVDIYFTTYPNR
jgi:outer membrane biosynthesis protein TonB